MRFLLNPDTDSIPYNLIVFIGSFPIVIPTIVKAIKYNLPGPIRMVISILHLLTKTLKAPTKKFYFIIKEQLETGELTENSIPVLFQDKFPIFEYLYNNKLIDNNDILTSNDIKNYLDALPKFNNNKSEQISDTMFSSSDPLYLFKKFDSEVSTE